MRKKFDLYPAALAFSQFPLNQPLFGFAPQQGFEDENVQEVNQQDDPPDDGDPVDPPALDSRDDVEDQQ